MAKDKDERTKLVFKTVVKVVEKLTGQLEYTLKYDEGTGRFSLSRGDSLGLIVSSVSLRDCVLAAEDHGVKYTPEELKISFKVVS